MNSNAEETGNLLFRCASCSKNYCWILVALEDPYNRPLFCFRLMCIDLWFINCVGIISSLWCTLKYFVSISFHQSTRVFFRVFVRLYGIPHEQIFFMAKCSCNILLMPIMLMSKDISISRYVTWRSCFIRSIFSDTKTDFGWLQRIFPGSKTNHD